MDILLHTFNSSPHGERMGLSDWTGLCQWPLGYTENEGLLRVSGHVLSRKGLAQDAEKKQRNRLTPLWEQEWFSCCHLGFLTLLLHTF